jgi:hypothetical protein
MEIYLLECCLNPKNPIHLPSTGSSGGIGTSTSALKAGISRYQETSGFTEHCFKLKI